MEAAGIIFDFLGFYLGLAVDCCMELLLVFEIINDKPFLLGMNTMII